MQVTNPTTPESITPFIPVAADDVCYWYCDEETQNHGSPATDIVSGVVLAQSNLALQPRYARGPSTTNISNGRYLYPTVTGFTSSYLECTTDPGAAAALFQTGFWTIEMFIRPAVVAGTTTIISYQAAGETQATNYQMSCSIVAG